MPNIFNDLQVADLEAFGLTSVKNTDREAVVDLPSELRHRITRKDNGYVLKVETHSFDLPDTQAVMDQFYNLYLAMQS